jgi:hypothetical protein
MRRNFMQIKHQSQKEIIRDCSSTIVCVYESSGSRNNCHCADAKVSLKKLDDGFITLTDSISRLQFLAKRSSLILDLQLIELKNLILEINFCMFRILMDQKSNYLARNSSSRGNLCPHKY